MTGRARRITAAALVGTLLPLTGCSDDGWTTLRVLAAASLSDVFTVLAEQFEAAHDDVEVQLSFGSSTDLAEQAADGAPGDILATADESAMTTAEDAGVVTDPATFATNVLVIVTPTDNPEGIATLDDLDGTTWVRCADDVPCGRVALAVLEAAGIDAEPSSLEEDVRATLDKVVSGEADGGLVYASDAVAAAGDVNAIPITGAEAELTSYLIGALDQSENSDLADEWVDLVTGPEGQAALTESGFGLP
jgi:molybdate transport system substrate-binding protein